MALNDRDRSFEKALASRLRSGTPTAACPDAETVAAYHERSLTPDELISWKSHIASCTNCQQILAHLEAVDAPTELAAAPRKSAAASVAQVSKPPRITNWRWLVPAGAIAAGLLIWVAMRETQGTGSLPAPKIEMAENRAPVEESKFAAPESARGEAQGKPAPLSKVIAPADKDTSALSGIENRRDIDRLKSPAAQLGDRAKSAAVERENPPLSATRQSRQKEKRETFSTDVRTGEAGGALGGVIGGVPSGRPAPQAEKKFDELAKQDQGMNYINNAATPPPPARAAKSPAAGQAQAPNQQGDAKQLQSNQSAGSPAPPSPGTQQAASNASGASDKIQTMSETVVVTSAAPVALPSAPASPSDEPKPSSRDASALSVESRNATDLVTLAPGAAAAPALRAAKGRAPRTIAAPGGKVIWRLGLYGSIEQSLDGGHTWTPQTSGTTENLFLGSAPSEQVCWVISVTGTILRTTDGGAHWLPIVSPIAQNLGFIRASDDLHATVWDMTRRHVFQTTDGGATWSPAPSH